MSEKDVFTIKEYVEKIMEEMKQSMSEIHKKIDTMTDIIQAHDKILLQNTITADTNKANNSRNWKIFFFASPFVLSFLGYVGYLYIEHIKREIVTLSIEEFKKTVEDYQPEVIIK